MELTTMSNFTDGRFEYQSAKAVYWSGVVEGRGYIDRAEKIIIPAQLYMPKNIIGKIPAMVIVHGIGGLYTRDGKKRAYWEYAELLAENGIAAVIVDTHGARGVGVFDSFSFCPISKHPDIPVKLSSLPSNICTCARVGCKTSGKV